MLDFEIADSTHVPDRTDLSGFAKMNTYLACYAPLAQLDRASDYESEGREFESLRARHLINHLPFLLPSCLYHCCCGCFLGESGVLESSRYCNILLSFLLSMM